MEIPEVLAMIIKISINTKALPDHRRITNVAALVKTKCKDKFSNYSPACLISLSVRFNFLKTRNSLENFNLYRI